MFTKGSLYRYKKMHCNKVSHKNPNPTIAPFLWFDKFDYLALHYRRRNVRDSRKRRTLSGWILWETLQTEEHNIIDLVGNPGPFQSRIKIHFLPPSYWKYRYFSTSYLLKTLLQSKQIPLYSNKYPVDNIFCIRSRLNMKILPLYEKIV